MKNYDAYSPKWFATNKEEVLKLKVIHYTTAAYERNLTRIRYVYGKDITYFALKKVPYGRNKYDYAKLLIIRKSDGSFLAKRHNNQQHLTLRF